MNVVSTLKTYLMVNNDKSIGALGIAFHDSAHKAVCNDGLIRVDHEPIVHVIVNAHVVCQWSLQK